MTTTSLRDRQQEVTFFKTSPSNRTFATAQKTGKLGSYRSFAALRMKDGFGPALPTHPMPTNIS